MSPLRSDTRNRIGRWADGHKKGPHYAVEPVDGHLCGNWTEPMSRPEVSILIPAYNEAQAIGDVVTKIAHFYPDYDIIVVNDGSTDDTEVVEKRLQVHSFTVTLITSVTVLLSKVA